MSALHETKECWKCERCGIKSAWWWEHGTEEYLVAVGGWAIVKSTTDNRHFDKHYCPSCFLVVD